MTRRLATALGALTVAGMPAPALPASAQAASGFLAANGRVDENPSGCLNISQTLDEMEIDNSTDRVVCIFSTADCSGDTIRTVGQNQGPRQVRGRVSSLPTIPDRPRPVFALTCQLKGRARP